MSETVYSGTNSLTSLNIADPLTFDSTTNPSVIYVDDMPVTPTDGTYYVFTVTATPQASSVGSAGSAVSYTIKLTFVSACQTATISDNSGGSQTLSNYLYSGQSTFTASFSVTPADCPSSDVVLSCSSSPLLPSEDDLCESSSYSYNTVNNPNSSSSTLQWTFDDSSFSSISTVAADVPAGTYTFTISAQIPSIPSVATSTSTVTVTFIHPCYNTAVTAQSTLTTDPLVVKIDSYSFFSASLTFDDSICDGSITYTPTPMPAWLYFDGVGDFTVSTSDLALRGTSTAIVITISLTDYPTISDTVSFSVMFITCEDVSIELAPTT